MDRSVCLSGGQKAPGFLLSVLVPEAVLEVSSQHAWGISRRLRLPALPPHPSGSRPCAGVQGPADVPDRPSVTFTPLLLELFLYGGGSSQGGLPSSAGPPSRPSGRSAAIGVGDGVSLQSLHPAAGRRISTFAGMAPFSFTVKGYLWTLTRPSLRGNSLLAPASAERAGQLLGIFLGHTPLGGGD